MKLTGKCKEDFLKQFCGVVPENEIELSAHIIDWFDSVGIYIVAYISSNYIWNYEIINKNKIVGVGLSKNNRTEAINEAIVKANEIFNTFEK